MSQPIIISCEEVLHQLKLSNQIPSIIEGIVTRKTLLSVVAELGIKVEPEELQQAADNIRLMNNLKTVEETRAWLENNHLSLDDFEKMVYINVISGKLAQHLFAEQVEPWFLEHQLEYAQAAIYEVTLEDKDLTSELFYALQKDGSPVLMVINFINLLVGWVYRVKTQRFQTNKLGFVPQPNLQALLYKDKRIIY